MDKFQDYAKRLLTSEDGKVRIQKITRMMAIADYLDCTMAQLAIAWCLKNQNIASVITGASSASQITENIGALRIVPKLSDTIMKQLEDILENKPVADHPPSWSKYVPPDKRPFSLF